MSSEDKLVFTKLNLDLYLKELAKEYRKLGGKNMPAEIVLIGGASVIVNYGFREMTTDIDAVIQASSTMKEAVNRVADRYELPIGWLNDDFKRTDSYSARIANYSKYYKSFYGVLSVRTICDEYLVAMKLMSGRQYKNDRSDIIGILKEHKDSGKPIKMKDIEVAVTDLYGSWEKLPESSRSFLSDILLDDKFEYIFSAIKSNEESTKQALLEFETKYPNAVNSRNVDEVVEALAKKMDTERQFEDDAVF